MSEQKRSVSRRDFGKKVAAGVAGVAAAVGLPRVVDACPVAFDEAGNRIAYTCAIDILIPELPEGTSLFLWKNCENKKVFEGVREATWPEGSCADAVNGDTTGCFQNRRAPGWRTIVVNGREVKVCSEINKSKDSKLIAALREAKWGS